MSSSNYHNCAELICFINFIFIFELSTDKVASYINHGAYADIYRASRISDGK